MNIFFGIESKDFITSLNIPRFRNDISNSSDYSLFRLNIINSNWNIEKLKIRNNSEFYFVNDNILNNEDIFILSNEKEIEKIKNLNEINDLNSFTNTSPAYRANLKISITNGGFSSYQSEYPYKMIKKNGSILSPLSTLLNINAEKNYLIFRNIYYKPILENFDIFLVNIRTKRILETFIAKTNMTNIIEIDKRLINSENYIFSKKYLGVPIFVSIKNKHLSMEHTHPPHEYIMSKDKFLRVSILKKQIDEIIS
tara:strand:+ start:772 stop:1533 length:762 start_codon:yes stop_codon:yes gene_type:complete